MRLSLIAGLALGVAGTLGAQSIETPTPFDTARRVLAITPPLAERLGLAAPIFPASGEFRDARLYAIQPGGGFVLVVQRASGVLERYALSDVQRAALQAAVDSAMAASGRPSNGAEVVSEPAGSSFARRQLLVAAAVYGPLAASLGSNGSSAGALWLITTGGTFFVSYGAAESGRITRAQSHSASDVGLGAGAAAWLVGYTATGRSDKGVRAASLGAALAGTIAGVNLGRRLTDAEAHAAWGGMKTAAATAWSAATVAGLPSRGIAATVAGSEAVGYAIGVHYPRRASYTVTAGDVDAVQTAGLIGALAGGALLGNVSHPSNRAIAAAVGPAYLVGLAIGDATIARPLDLTQSDATIANVGAVAGGLVALALPVLAGSSNRSVLMGTAAGGAALGMAIVIGLSNKAHGASASERGANGAGRMGRIRLAVDGAPLLGALTKRPGQYTVVRVTF